MYRPITNIDDWIIFTNEDGMPASYKSETGDVSIWIDISPGSDVILRIEIHIVPGFWCNGGTIKGVALSIKEPKYIFDNKFCSMFTKSEKEKVLYILKINWDKLVFDINRSHYYGAIYTGNPRDIATPEWKDIPANYPMPDYDRLETEED